MGTTAVNDVLPQAVRETGRLYDLGDDTWALTPSAWKYQE